MGSAEHFTWHAAARLVGADGLVVEAPAPRAPQGAAGGWLELDEAPAARVLPAALAAVDAGLGFAIRPAALPAGAAPLAPRGAGRFASFTGGTTGAPRRLLRRQASWTASFAVNRAHLGIGPGRAVAILGRLGHSLALYSALEALHLGASLHDLAGLRPDRQAAAIAARGIDTLWITPAQLTLLLRAAPDPLPGVRLVLVGGAALAPEARARARVLMPGADLRVFYGTAETSFIALSDAETPEGSVGRPYPGVRLALGHDGALRVASPYLAGDPPPAEVETGEIARRDDAGNLFILGRRDRMVTVADVNVFPERAEALLARDPRVAHCGVVALPDALRGARLVGLVCGTLDAGARAALLADCRAELGPLAAPHRLLALESWPLLPSGKTDYAALARLARDRAA